MSELIVKNLNKSFGKYKILHSIHLKMNHGLFGLLGPNGAGKTTLMRTLATILIADSGEIQYKGMNWRKQPDEVRQMLGYLPQHFGVFRNISAMECMDYIASLKGIHDKKTEGSKSKLYWIKSI
ncbi:ATP-binding cassette domain-containing protein [Paenibacillus popilliae]|uniref:ATPase component n=1 Tax=Paenibacillus popilliae ATCC 14706 TaxID=1212764 RepID=M9M4T7_PAEPP|nr:ATP-binding cassette domain-containing protein [Paenibacillus popilliae]GAC42328.1 ATPase component [Paenibacillus popilliae ATCC 14706]